MENSLGPWKIGGFQLNNRIWGTHNWSDCGAIAQSSNLHTPAYRKDRLVDFVCDGDLRLEDVEQHFSESFLSLLLIWDNMIFLFGLWCLMGNLLLHLPRNSSAFPVSLMICLDFVGKSMFCLRFLVLCSGFFWRRCLRLMCWVLLAFLCHLGVSVAEFRQKRA